MKLMPKFISSWLLLLLIYSHAFGQEYKKVQSLISQGREDEALALLEKNPQPNNISYLNLKGEALMRKGRYDKALEVFEKAEYLQETADRPDEKQQAATYSFIAVLHWTTGNNQLALQYHFKALDLRQQMHDAEGIAASTNDIGLVYSRANPRKALEYYEKALADYLELYGEKSDRVVTSYVNIGIAYSNLDQQVQALDNMERALNIRQLLGKGSAQEAFILSGMGKVYARQQEYDKALAAYEKALAIYRKVYGDKHPEIASTLYLMGSVRHTRGEFKTALQDFQQALAANISSYHNTDVYDNPPLQDYYNADVLLRTLLEKAKTFEDLHYNFSLKIKDLTTAYHTIGLCDSLIDKIRQFRVSEADKVALGALAYDVYEAAVRLSMEMTEVNWAQKPFMERAFYFADKSKSAVLLDAIADANAKSYAGIPDDLLEQEKIIKAEVAYYQQKLAGKPSPEEEISYRKALFEWTKSYNDFIDGLEQLYPTYFNLKHNVKIPEVAEIQQKLAPGEAMLSYFVADGDQVVYAFVISPKKFRVYQKPLQEKYDLYISAYRNAMYYQAPQTYRLAARKLYDQLVFFKIPPGTQKIIVVPSGRMATIPFEGLLTRDQQVADRDFKSLAYMVRDYDFAYQYSAGLYMDPLQATAANASIALLAPVEFNSTSLPPLPGTEKEVEEINDLFAGGQEDVELYLKDEANLNTIRSEKVTKSKYLHFATHGIVDEKRPERSQICLAATHDQAGNLYTGDIYALDLAADLVVLSACETGLGKISKGEGIIGLTRALIYAGTNNLVVSLWQVNDASTSILMTNFYRAMLQGNGYAAALAQAKRAMINDPGHAAPFYWAPFVLVGE